jgi:fructose-1-phosphate kinase PfkB-like protein
MTIRRVVILEFAPTADEIWLIPQHDRDGYSSYNMKDGLVSILDTAHDAKPRPEIITTYAGGKATNVARVLDRLLTGADEPCVELVTFLPPPEATMQDLRFGTARDIPLVPSTAAGIYVQCLQMEALRSVKPRFEVVDELRERDRMQATRRCIEMTFEGASGSLNFSPRIVWSQEAAQAVRDRAAQVTRNADLVVMAGSPPTWEAVAGTCITPHSFYMEIVNALESGCRVSIDSRGRYLHKCLAAKRMPQFIFMNKEEFTESAESWEQLIREAFPGIFMVHDEHGCWVWDSRLPDGADPFSEAQYFPSVSVSRVYSTIGAGDAMHAGFLKEWICSGTDDLTERLHRSVIYSQIVAAVSVSNEKATHGIHGDVVNNKFRSRIARS